ncbi:MAG: CAP domain-containing protein [Alphaproteobacteria bacterium]|nr:CAP domain-containing protein [Alphaproteobacteria bacterium]
MLWTLLLGTAFAGYGDAVDGLPRHDERELHLWTDIARMQPDAFEDELSCWSAFTSDERQPKAPMAMDMGLIEAARFHSNDMDETEARKGKPGSGLSHDSSDGTSMGERVARFYDRSYVGENVAWNYPDARSVVVGWLCSTGHRANIMNADYDEFGGGIVDNYYTQDFGSSGRGPQPLNVGVHLPERPSGRVELWVDAYGDEVSNVAVLVDGTRYPMKLQRGEANQGAYRTMLAVNDGNGCHVYWFSARVDGEVARFPEEGAYGWGDCDYDDADAGWLGPKVVATYDVDDEDTGGCDVSGGARGASWLGLVLGGLALGRRRRTHRS